MKKADLEMLAASEAEMPSDLSEPEIMYFLALRAFAQSIKISSMDKSQIRREKLAIDRAYSNAEAYTRYAKYSADVRNRISGSLSTYRKAAKSGDTETMLQAASSIVGALDNIPI